jgi:hypothetical protein
MKVALFAAAASLVLAFAAHAADMATPAPLAAARLSTVCAAGVQKTSFIGEADVVAETALCPQFLSTLLMKLPHRDQRT